MIPLRDVIPSRTTPYVTISLVVINALVFLYELSLGDQVNEFMFYFGLVPAYFSWASVLTSMFLHGGFLHVAGNMLYLWIFGDNVEDQMGHGRFLAFYVLCGVAAALGQTLTVPDSMVPMVGASGAIAGVMGAYFILYPHSRVVTLVTLLFFWQIMPSDEPQLLSDRREGRCVLSYKTSGGWVAITKAILTDVLEAGRDVKIVGLPPVAVGVLKLMCPTLVVLPQT